MNTNYQMLRELLKVYEPEHKGFYNRDEEKLIKDMLHIDEMDILALRNLRDFTVIYMGHAYEPVSKEWDMMSAITHVIDVKIIELGGEV